MPVSVLFLSLVRPAAVPHYALMNCPTGPLYPPPLSGASITAMKMQYRDVRLDSSRCSTRERRRGANILVSLAKLSLSLFSRRSPPSAIHPGIHGLAPPRRHCRNVAETMDRRVILSVALFAECGRHSDVVLFPRGHLKAMCTALNERKTLSSRLYSCLHVSPRTGCYTNLETFMFILVGRKQFELLRMMLIFCPSINSAKLIRPYGRRHVVLRCRSHELRLL